MTGVRFTSYHGVDAGKDTTDWVLGSGTGLVQAKVWRVTEYLITASLPDDIAKGFYMVWVQNSHGVSRPIPLNRVIADWIGPLGTTHAPGSDIRVFGRNMVRDNWPAHQNVTVYLQPVSGGEMVECWDHDVVDMFNVQFRIPVQLTNGEYRVYVHNHQGGVYGWSDPLRLIIDSAPFQRGSTNIDLAPSGGDDTAALQGAVDTISAQPGGGTVTLQAGTFNTTNRLFFKTNVEVRGAGMEATTIVFRPTAVIHSGFTVQGDQVTLRDLSLLHGKGIGGINYGLVTSAYPGPIHDAKLINIRIGKEDGIVSKASGINGVRVEITGCQFFHGVTLPKADGWIHDSTFYVSPHQESGNTTIIERNHFETRDWPNVDGNRQYKELLSEEERAWRPWCGRVYWNTTNYGSGGNVYIAHNTTKDVAEDGNTAEMILLHGVPAGWFGEVISANGLQVELRTDSTYRGQPGVLVDGIANGPVPDKVQYAKTLDNEAYLAIVQGPGLGQLRKIVAHTPTSVTVDREWRVPPTAESVAIIAHYFVNTTIYRNELNAFPVGYKLIRSASTPVSFWGNSAFNYADTNTSHRTFSASMVWGFQVSPSMWNEFRDQDAYACDEQGILLQNSIRNPDGKANIIGAATLGNAWRSGMVEVTSSEYWWKEENSLIDTFIRISHPHSLPDQESEVAFSEGNIFEGVTAWGFSRGIGVGRWTGNLFRNNRVTVQPEVRPATTYLPRAVHIDLHAQPILSGNQYAGDSTVYHITEGHDLGQLPTALHRTARLEGAVGHAVVPVSLPLANTGVAPMAWSVAADQPWIVVTASGANPVEPEMADGQVMIDADTTGLGAGNYAGTVTVTTGNQSHSLGVWLVLQ